VTKLEIKFISKPYMPTLLAASLLLFSNIFLPWTTDGATGTAGWGAISSIAGIIGVLLAFLTIAKIRGIGLIVVGILALVGAIVFITKLGNATVGFGLILEMILSLVAVYVGVMDAVKNK
jgi:hypothetical protein